MTVVSLMVFNMAIASLSFWYSMALDGSASGASGASCAMARPQGIPEMAPRAVLALSRSPEATLDETDAAVSLAEMEWSALPPTSMDATDSVLPVVTRAVPSTDDDASSVSITSLDEAKYSYVSGSRTAARYGSSEPSEAWSTAETSMSSTA